MSLPLFELTVDEQEESFVGAIALVENPAIIARFLTFFKQKPKIKYCFNDERQELYGPAMVPDLPIYRRDEDGTEYNVFFSADTIKKIEKIYFKKGFQKNINIEHTEEDAGCYIFESHLIDRKNGINPKDFVDYADGSWMVRMQAEDNNVWKDIKAGKRNGFSVEGVFKLLKTDFSAIKSEKHINKYTEDELLLDELIQELKQTNSLLESINL